MQPEEATLAGRVARDHARSMKCGEAPEVCIQRQVQEEVRRTLDVVYSLGIFTGRQAYRRDTVYVFVAQVSHAAIQIDPGEIFGSELVSRGSSATPLGLRAARITTVAVFVETIPTGSTTAENSIEAEEAPLVLRTAAVG